MNAKRLLFLGLSGMLFALGLDAQQTLVVQGVISNINHTPVPVHIDVDLNTTYAQQSVVMTDSVGHYIDSFAVSHSQGSVEAWIVDCNSDTISGRGGYYTLHLTVVINLDHCANPAHSCTALFSKQQAYNNHQQPVPYLVHVIDHSTGSGLSYFWDFGDGHTSTNQSPTHTYAGNGPYWLCLTVSNANCTNTYCDSVAIDSSGHLKSGVGFTIDVGGKLSGIQELMNTEITFKLYPNPAQDHLQLLVHSQLGGSINLKVRDSFGRLFMEKAVQIQGGNQQIELKTASLEHGLYIVEINFNGLNESLKFMK